MIQVHSVDLNGKTIGITNRFAADNTDLFGDAKRKALMAKAAAAADHWGRIFPENKYVVVEISRKDALAQMKWYPSAVV